MKRTLLFGLTVAASFQLYAQRIAIKDGWKFKTGDDVQQWQLANFNDADWKPINVSKSWEANGYQDYDGFAWYRLHVVIPSSLKTQALFNDSLKISLGQLDDGDEVYLNGTLIGKNNNEGGDIQNGSYGLRTYTIAADNPLINWDKENVLAVRVFDSGGPGGMYGRNFSVWMPGLPDVASFSTNYDFTKNTEGNLSTQFDLKSKIADRPFKGAVKISLIDPEFKKTISEKTVDAGFDHKNPFHYQVNFPGLENRSYTLQYVFADDVTGGTVTASVHTPYMLTPKVKPAPKINTPVAYGARAGHPVLYRIPVTGLQPLNYKVSSLPAGLHLDAATGIISGEVKAKGNYPIQITVQNKAGVAKKTMTLKIGDKIGLTPVLGWNSWNAWGLSVSDEKVRISAREMADKLVAHGWAYINIDDGWEAPERAENGEIVTNEKFPDMKALSDYVHGLGLKMGIYTSPGPLTCGGYLGSYQHEAQDAQTYGKWGIDYLKHDWCSYSDIAPKPDLAALKKPYQVMRKALNGVDRDIIYSLCQYGWGDVYKWGGAIGANSWRTTGDITDTWQSLSTIGFSQAKSYGYSKPGQFIDPDMLVVGKVGWGPQLHNTRLTPDEQYTHLSLWSLLSAPLLIGCDMGQLDEFTLNLLTNDEVIAIDQDIKGIQAKRVIDHNDYQVWVKELADGSKAVGIFNTTEDYKTITLQWADAGISGYKTVRDVWTQTNLGNFGKTLTVKVPPHGVRLLKTF